MSGARPAPGAAAASDDEVGDAKRIRRRGPGPRLRLAMLALALASLFLVLALTGSLSPEAVEDRVEEAGPVAVPVFIVTGALLTCVMFPGPILAGASGLLFGTALGTPVAICSATLGASLACAIGRFVAGDAVTALAGPRILGLAEWVSRRGFLSVLYARILPGMPYNVVNYACGLTTIPVLTVAAATAIGTAPRTFAYVALGGSFGDFSSPEAIIAFAIIVGMGVTGLVLVRRDLKREGRLPKRW
jgi:uncharacterized membrane protein YdjX (TVP38/TMEM64 family)